MTIVNELYSLLKLLLKTLYEEKEALIHNDAYKVAEIVDRKNEIIEKLSQVNHNHIPSGESPTLKLINEIKTVQETNLLLTKQSLSFQNILLESIAKNLQSMSNTYSSKGSYEKTNIGLIDQKV